MNDKNSLSYDTCLFFYPKLMDHALLALLLDKAQLSLQAAIVLTRHRQTTIAGIFTTHLIFLRIIGIYYSTPEAHNLYFILWYLLKNLLFYFFFHWFYFNLDYSFFINLCFYVSKTNPDKSLKKVSSPVPSNCIYSTVHWK